MNYHKGRIVSWAFLAAIVINNYGCAPRRGDQVLQTWETSNESFKLRIRQFNEKVFLGLPGYYYAFEATDQNRPDQWREVASIRTDDDVGMPREQVRFVNPSVAYFFMGQIYVVTVDGGHTWYVWDVAKHPECDGFIKAVRVGPDGTGVMTFDPIPNKGRQPPDLFTNDYGQHWQPK